MGVLYKPTFIPLTQMDINQVTRFVTVFDGHHIESKMCGHKQAIANSKPAVNII